MIPASTPRWPSITESPDAHAVLCSDESGTLPAEASDYSVAALLGGGYIAPADDAHGVAGGAWTLTATGLELRARWREIRAATSAGFRRGGAFTEPERLPASVGRADYIAEHYSPDPPTRRY
jgi:hypothetical protein